MSGPSEDSDYWEVSRVQAFSFDDEHEIKFSTLDNSQPFEQLAMRIRADISNDIDVKDTQPTLFSTDMPLHTIISDDALQCILQVQSGESVNNSVRSNDKFKRCLDDITQGPAPNDLLKFVLFQRPFVLENCKSLNDKISILDEAIKFGDGDSILMAVLWIQKTVNRKIFQDVLRTRTLAVQNYISYLIDRNQSSALTDLLVMLGKSNETVTQQFQLIMSQPLQTRLKKLNMLYTSHCTQPNVCSFIANTIAKYISLLEWQVENSIRCTTNSLGLTVIQVLYWLCMNHWNDHDTGSKYDPKVFAKLQHISSMQYDWTVILARSIKQDWHSIRTLYIKTGFLKKRQVSTPIPIDKLILQLHKLEAPIDLLEELLNFLSEPKKTIVTRAISAI